MSAVAEHALVALARLFSRSEVAHSSEMKAALRDPAQEQAYRANEIDRVKVALERYRVPVVGRTVLDLGCNDGALTAGLANLGGASSSVSTSTPVPLNVRTSAGCRFVS